MFSKSTSRQGSPSRMVALRLVFSFSIRGVIHHGSGSRIKEDHFIGSLNDLRGGAYAWHAVRLALKKWIHGIRVSIQVLDFIPELRLIERSVGIHSSRELAVDGLISLIATPLLIR